MAHTSRKRVPADQAGPGRAEIWATIRRIAPASFSVADVFDVTGIPQKTIRGYLKALASAEYLELQPREPGKAMHWILVRDVGMDAPRVRADGSTVTQGEVTHQLWRGMYMLKDFTFRDLIETASISISEDAARAYCKVLLSTGYLKVLQRADPPKGRIARYRLIRNNGPRPPQVQRIKRIFDPNTDEVFNPAASS